MHEVMSSAQTLAEAILKSEVYQKMNRLEKKMTEDPEASSALALVLEKRAEVKACLDCPEALAAASEALHEAERKLNSIPIVVDTKKARQDFSDMMDNVNRILRLIVTGEVEDETKAGGCTGNCASCSGCH